jgi:hypothetical protein
VDTIDSPPPMQGDWSWLGTLMGYLLAFTAGFLTAKSLKWRPKKRETKVLSALEREVEHTNDPKQLLALLAAADSERFKLPIEALETLLYGKKRGSIGAIKKEIFHIISEERL